MYIFDIIYVGWDLNKLVLYCIVLYYLKSFLRMKSSSSSSSTLSRLGAGWKPRFGFGESPGIPLLTNQFAMAIISGGKRSRICVCDFDVFPPVIWTRQRLVVTRLSVEWTKKTNDNSLCGHRLYLSSNQRQIVWCFVQISRAVKRYLVFHLQLLA